MGIKVLSWREYGLYDECEHDQEHINAVVESIIKNKYCFSGLDHQSYEFGVPVFNDDTVGIFTPEEWGKIMAISWNKIHRTKEYDAFDFAFRVPFHISNKYPERKTA